MKQTKVRKESASVPDDSIRTLVLAGLQLFPVVGGAAGEIVGHFWKSAFERKVDEMFRSFAAEIERLNVAVSWIRERVADNDSAQCLFIDAVRATLVSVSMDQRIGLGLLLARGLSSTERDVVDATFLLRIWGGLDEIEMLLFMTVGRAHERMIQPELGPELFGEDYFQGVHHDEVMYKDDIHRQRIDHLMRLGLLRPIDPEGWKAGKYGYYLKHFKVVGVGRRLYQLVAPFTDGASNV